MRVLICGGGVIGASTAYFLTRRGVMATVFERSRLACAASGKAGGFLALDWCDGTPLEALARRSFALHARLAREVDGNWGYRRLTTYSGFAGADDGDHSRGGKYDLPWLADGVTLQRRLGSVESTAQVNPGQFTAALMRGAQAHGAELRLACVSGLVGARRGGAVTGV